MNSGMAIFIALFWLKVFSLAIIFYFMKVYKSKEFYYYQNLGISRVTLWVSAFVIDFSLFVFLLILTDYI
jgi:type III secretory pathway component EscU